MKEINQATEEMKIGIDKRSKESIKINGYLEKVKKKNMMWC
jgi:hypothetical protein